MIKVAIDRQVMQSVLSRVADQINGKINLNFLKKLCKERYGIETIEGAENKNANIVIIDNKIACKLDFEVRFPMSVLITTKENSNITITEKSALQAEIDYLTEDELDEIAADLYDIEPNELDVLKEDEVDEILPEDLEVDKLDDVIAKDIGQP